MLEPSIDRLQEKIDSKYSLVIVSAKRARELQDGATSLVEDPKAQTFVGKALEEIYHEKVFIKDA